MSASASFSEILGTAATIIAIGGGALGLYRGAAARYRQTIGSRRILTMRLRRMRRRIRQVTRQIEGNINRREKAH